MFSSERAINAISVLNYLCKSSKKSFLCRASRAELHAWLFPADGNFINKDQVESVCVDLMLMLMLTFSIGLTLAAGAAPTARRGSET